MESIKPIHHYLLVEMNKEFNDTITIGETELFLDTTYDNYKHACQNGKVFAVSDGVEGVGVGDTVWFHHFVPADYDMDANQISNHDKLLEKEFGKRLYWVDAKPASKGGAHQLFLYENDKGVNAYLDTVMVRPIIIEAEKTKSGIILEAFEKKEVFEEGEIAVSNSFLEDNGFNVGDKVKFSKNSEYEIEVNGEILYRMRTEDILLKYEADA